MTTIHYLLPAGTFSAFHRVAADEVWCHSGGDALELHVASATGAHQSLRIGPDPGGGDLPHATVPAGHWQAARPLGARYTLATCVVAPGFQFSDFELATRDELARALPSLASLVAEFTTR